MNVLFISQCEGSARVETCRILDAFAERCGDSVWQTAITKQGLDTVYTLLRKTARKNTAVICRWTHGINHSDIVWVVGNPRIFNEYGAVATNFTAGKPLPTDTEDQWRTLEDLTLLVRLAALFHDFGKATLVFQKKLLAGKPVADAFRHEWVSIRLFQAFIVNPSDDRGWLGRLAALPEEPFSVSDMGILLKRLQKDTFTQGPELWKMLPPLARVVAWLILGHHRLPMQGWQSSAIKSAALRVMPSPVSAAWGYRSSHGGEETCSKIWQFVKLPFLSSVWCRRASVLAKRVLARPCLFEMTWLENVFSLHIGRMALMLADHEYSGRQDAASRYTGDASYTVHANTNKEGTLNQRLDEHLVGVEKTAASILRMLPRLSKVLPVLGQRQSFRRRSGVPRFHWQDKAFDLCSELAQRTRKQGFFGINIASTGCGKTLANARICYALGEQGRVRFTVALGLRTLTFQTGEAYRARLGLGASDVGILAGNASTRDLYGFNWDGEREEYQESFLSPDSFLDYEQAGEDPLSLWMKGSPDALGLLEAPILCCTIDHLAGATEGVKGGRQLAPMLRLLSANLVLDEPDDFAQEDMYALSRLVYWAGMLGSRVILSSATIPEAFASGLFEAYRRGRAEFRKNCGEERPLPICCGWFDEFGATSSEVEALDTFQRQHHDFVVKRVGNLARREIPRRHVGVLSLDSLKDVDANSLTAKLVPELWRAIDQLHEDNAIEDPLSGKKISCGIVRMANIDPLVDVAMALLEQGIPDGWHVHLCCYHAHYPLCMRSALEYNLDRLLCRTMDDHRFCEQVQVQRLLAKSPARNHVVLVLATPVAEVGRDHDYDWAIMEPSSMRSIIQLAGRVRRHRPQMWDKVNILLWSHNLKGLCNPLTTPVFCRPGFESAEFPLKSHDVRSLLTPDQLKKIDASLRILERKEGMPEENLADRELDCIRQVMLGGGKIRSVSDWWLPHATLCGELQRANPFRREQEPQEEYAFVLRDGEQKFCRIGREGLTDLDNLCERLELKIGLNISFLLEETYEDRIFLLSETKEMNRQSCSLRFGRVTLPVREQGWFYHDGLGFRRRR